jgi:aminoglycoside 6'-N-acetyltransferase
MTKAANNQVSLQPFDPYQHAAFLQQWVQAPHVADWWGNPELVLQEVLTPAEGGGDALILVGSTPVGYVRWQIPPRHELEAAGLQDIPGDAVDIDIAIGEPSHVGRGFGSQALRLVVQHLFTQTRAPMLMMCASTDNARAIRAYENAGFELVRTFQDPLHGTMWLMVMKRQC